MAQAPVQPDPDGRPRGPRGPLALTLLALLGVVLFCGFVALGTWQVHRRAWKLDLMARVNQRVHAPPAAAPGPSEWPKISAEADEYLHVYARGRLLNDRQTMVWANSSDGSGYWVMTPLLTDQGAVVMVNRGFVPHDWCSLSGKCAAGPSGEVTVTGLLRMSQTSAFMRHNHPAKNDWYTRDARGIARARGLDRTAPYFIDADAAVAADTHAPVGGLTVIHFPNNHLGYLITWYVMALMVLLGGFYVGRSEYRLRRREMAGGRES